jgi:hypothetical protein
MSGVAKAEQIKWWDVLDFLLADHSLEEVMEMARMSASRRAVAGRAAPSQRGCDEGAHA